MTHNGPGPVALVGSGEYLAEMEDVERGLLAGRAPRWVQLATAAAPEGPASLRYWHDLGAKAARRLGVEQVVVPVVDRATAQDPALATLVRGAGLVYLSGGDPVFLTATLRDTAVWKAIHDAWRAGAALAGCSAGAMALCSEVVHPRHSSRTPEAGLGVVPDVRVLPHFDRLAAWVGTAGMRHLATAPPGVTVLGLDEDTALVGGPDVWRVEGRQAVWVVDGEDRRGHPAGSTLTLPRQTTPAPTRDTTAR